MNGEKNNIPKFALKNKLMAMKDFYFDKFRKCEDEKEKEIISTIIDDVSDLIDICQERNKF